MIYVDGMEVSQSATLIEGALLKVSLTLTVHKPKHKKRAELLNELLYAVLLGPAHQSQITSDLLLAMAQKLYEIEQAT